MHGDRGQQGQRLEPAEVVVRRVRGDELAVDDEDQVELRGLGLPGPGALLLGPVDDPRATAVGTLQLTWYSAPGWTVPSADQPIPLVAFDEPCVLRTRAMDTLSRHALTTVIGADAIQLAGVQAAVGAGLGVALMATLGQTPERLIPRHDLPAAEPIALGVWPRPGLPPDVSRRAVEALRELLATPAATCG